MFGGRRLRISFRVINRPVFRSRVILRPNRSCLGLLERLRKKEKKKIKGRGIEREIRSAIACRRDFIMKTFNFRGARTHMSYIDAAWNLLEASWTNCRDRWSCDGDNDRSLLRWGLTESSEKGRPSSCGSDEIRSISVLDCAASFALRSLDCDAIYINQYLETLRTSNFFWSSKIGIEKREF